MAPAAVYLCHLDTLDPNKRCRVMYTWLWARRAGLVGSEDDGQWVHSRVTRVHGPAQDPAISAPHSAWEVRASHRETVIGRRCHVTRPRWAPLVGGRCCIPIHYNAAQSFLPLLITCGVSYWWQFICMLFNNAQHWLFIWFPLRTRV